MIIQKICPANLTGQQLSHFNKDINLKFIRKSCLQSTSGWLPLNIRERSSMPNHLTNNISDINDRLLLTDYNYSSILVKKKNFHTFHILFIYFFTHTFPILSSKLQICFHTCSIEKLFRKKSQFQRKWLLWSFVLLIATEMFQLFFKKVLFLPFTVELIDKLF